VVSASAGLWSGWSPGRALIDGVALAGVLTIFVVGVIRWNVAIFQGDFQESLKAKLPPMSQKTKRQRRVVAPLLFLLLFGVPILVNLQVRHEHGGHLSFLSAYVQAYLMFMLFNLADLIFVDYLVIVRWRPGFVVLPGTEGAPEYDDIGKHVRDFGRGMLIGLGTSAFIALATFSW